MPSIEVPVATARRSTLQRLNSRDILRSLPSESDALAVSVKRERLLRQNGNGEPSANRKVAPPLAPKVLAPLHHSKASEASHRLQHIECIEISKVTQKEDGHIYYTINVYMQQQASQIPTNQARYRRVLYQHQHDHHHKSHQHLHKPAYSVERRFSDFDRLRHQMIEAVQQPHRHYCNFCEGYLVLLLFSTSQPTILTKALVHSTSSRARMLTRFLHRIVDEFQFNRPRCRFPCHANGVVPTLLHDFLFGHKDDEEEEQESEPGTHVTNPASPY